MKKGIRAVLQAAGQGKRMKSTRPKVLHEVLGRAVISRVLDALDALELEHIHIIIGHGADQVRAYLEANPPASPWSVHLQEPQLGTGHALMQVVTELGSFKGTLLTTVGDAPLLTAAVLNELLKRHQDDGATVTLLSAKVEDSRNYGRVVRQPDGGVLAIVEDKDATPQQKDIGEINCAIYCFQWPDIAEGLKGLSADNRQKEYYLTDLIGWAVNKKLKVSSSMAPDWREVSGINSRLELAEACRLLRDRVVCDLALGPGVTVVDPSSTWIAPEARIDCETVILPGCYITGSVEIGQSCVIGPHTVMQGPVTVGRGTTVTQSLITNSKIGSDCRIGPFAHLRDGVLLSDHVRIGNFVELKKTEVGQQTNISHLSYVGDAQVGDGANVGAGTITANYDHITKTKSRTKISDGASTGSNSVLVAPVTLGKDATVAAGSVITRDVPDGALAVGRARQENKPGWADKKRQKLPQST